MIVPKLSINQSIYLVTVEVAENDYFIVEQTKQYSQ